MPDPDQTSASHLANALRAHDYNQTQWLLEHRFHQVATGEYAWLTELQSLGYSILEITDELLEKAILGPWIFEPFTPLDPPLCKLDFHLRPCVHNPGSAPAEANMAKAQDSETLMGDPRAAAPILTARESIEYYCGLAGVQPEPEGSAELQHGAVTFSEDMSVATVTLVGPEDGSALLQVLENLEKAAGTLQTLGGCCSSFTFLLLDRFLDNPWESEGFPCVELHKVPFSIIRRLRDYLTASQEAGSDDGFDAILHRIWPFLESSSRLLFDVKSMTMAAIRTSLAPLVTQFLSLALLSYAQAHCGSIKPFFLDTPLRAVVLRGSRLGPKDPMAPLEMDGSLMQLTCMGEMTEKPVFVFRRPRFGKLDLLSTNSKLPLFASVADVLDTWGPGAYVPESPNDPCSPVVSVYVGDGTITSAEPRTAETFTAAKMRRLLDRTHAPARKVNRRLHWTRRGSKLPCTELEPFDQLEKYIIDGTTIIENAQCAADTAASLRNALPLLQELGTSPTYWDPAERELGLGLHGSGFTTLQFNQTWVKMPGMTKKSALLRQPALFLSDLDSFFGVQVSICTGIARRVRLRDLLADLVPTYIASLLAPPPLYSTVLPGLVPALRGSSSLATLDHEHLSALQELALAVLNLLRDTGVDPRLATGSDATLVVACVQPGLPFQCFKIPCRASSYWARMLADSEDTATFAYVTTQCLETGAIRCGGVAAWRNEAALLSTAVSSCDGVEERVVATTVAAGAAGAGLRHADAYLIGRADAALAVRVDRPREGEEPRLLASCSTIPAQYLHRIFRKARPGKSKRLREMKCFDHRAESVVVLVGGPREVA